MIEDRKSIHALQRIYDFWTSFRFLFPIITAAFVGISTGFIAVGFIKMIAMCRGLFFDRGKETLSFLGPFYVLLLPALGGLLVGPLVTHFAPEAKGHGIPEVLKAIAIRGGKIRPVVVVVKALASILSLGSGFSVGREGPIVQVGAAFGSSTGQIFKFNTSRMKNLIACGAAAGIAAVFNAPIAGVMFASEVILKDFGASALSTVVVAAVSSSIISQMFLGASPAFAVPSYHLQSPLEIFIYLGLAVLSAFIAVGFILSLQQSERFWEKVKVPEWFKPVLGGLLVGAIGVFFPQVFSSGFEIIESALHGNLPLLLLLALVVMKMLATVISLGSGSSGGVFAPALFMGAVLGGAIGRIVAHHFAFPIEDSGAYALVGMACVFAAAAHAPVTAMLIVFEMTDNYHLILPIMAAVVVATTVSQFLHKESIYTVKLKEKGIDVGFLEEARILNGLKVKDAMSNNFGVVPNNLPVQDLFKSVIKNGWQPLFTVDKKSNLVGIVKYEDVQRYLLEEGVDGILIEDITLNMRDHCYAEDYLQEVTRQLVHNHLPYLPVVDAADPRKFIGVLRSEDVLRVYSQRTKEHQ